MTARQSAGEPVARGFVLPEASEAHVPPEARGVPRDGVRMAVATPGGTRHLRAHDLPEVLRPGDLLVVNTSATLPAAVDVDRNGGTWTVHVSTQLDDGAWVVELRMPDGSGPACPGAGTVLRLPGGVRLRFAEPHPAGQWRLWRAVPLPAVSTVEYLHEHGRPIHYPYLDGTWPLEDLQNVYADRPGSAEMPSAGRPLTERVLLRLLSRGIPVAPVELHTGVSSQEGHEPPQPELFTVPAVTARLVNSTRDAGRRVVAVGTTVARALESATAGDRVVPTTGWTDLVLGPHRPVRVVDGLLTGLHEPDASHLDLLDAVAGRALVERAYADVTAGAAPSYLWHEFGDTMLLLP
jgi:S-adenosylmethionine:tRNA ribosyltransferase-isomerase